MDRHFFAPLLVALLLAAPGAWAGPRGEDSDRRPARSGDAHESRRSKEHPPLTEQEIAEALAVLRDYKPELAERVAEVRERTPEATGSVLARHVPWIRRMIHLRRNDPDHYALQLEDIKITREAGAVAGRLRKTEDGKTRAALSARLEKLVSAHFEVRQKLRRAQLEAMRQRLETFEQRIAQREATRDRLIAERVAALTTGAGSDGDGRRRHPKHSRWASPPQKR